MPVSDLPFDGLDQSDEDVAFLRRLAAERGYVVHEERRLWLEWPGEAGRVQHPDIKRAEEAFRSLYPFEPFRYRRLVTSAGVAPSVPEPTFLGATRVTSGGQGHEDAHVRDFAGRLVQGQVPDDRLAHPDKLGWLIAYRDALLLELRRCAARLDADQPGEAAPMPGALATLKVWVAEAVAASGELAVAGAVDPSTPAMVAWNGFKAGSPWGDDVWLRSSPAVAKLNLPRLNRAVTVATIAGLRHHAYARDLIAVPARAVWPRLLAAETVLQAALTGIPLTDAWVNEAIRQQQNEAEAAERLREILLTPQKLYDYVLNELKPWATLHKKKRSVWEDVYDLLAEDWKKAGLHEDSFPYDTAKKLERAVGEGLRKRRVGGA